jgi:2-oxoglutarate ferredoxin oxidoreductase subunit beta
MKTLKSVNHDSTNRLAAMALAQDYGKELYTGVFYKNPDPPPSLDALVKSRQAELAPLGAAGRARIFDLLVQK